MLIYERIVFENDSFQWRMTINVFNGIEYFHLRKYIMDFEETWIPIKEGVSFPLEIDNIRELFVGLLEILSLGESRQAIVEHFSELLENIYQPKATE
jgi:hypothetical protein